jgi:23S rRNA pseudouridine1911/1915/1917 synthase
MPHPTSAEPDKIETVVTLDVPSGYQEGERLDVYITAALPNTTRSKVQKGIKEGRVDVGGKVVKRVSHSVQAGDRITCRLLKPPPMEVRPEAIPLDVAYEDEHLLVVNKPAGMVVHPAFGHRTGTLVHALLHHVGGAAVPLEDASEDDLDEDEIGLSVSNALGPAAAGPTFRPGIVHRLDKDTSGLLVVAKHGEAHAALARQFMERTTRRTYQAIVWGVPDPADGTVATDIGRDSRDRKRMNVVAEGQGKHAVTHYRTLEPLIHAALVAFRLETGRTHQIRVHARHIGHPIVGDPTYGGQTLRYGAQTGKRVAFFRNLFALLPRQALHAHTLGFEHPATGEAMDFEAPLPDDMQEAWRRLRRVEGGA